MIETHTFGQPAENSDSGSNNYPQANTNAPKDDRFSSPPQFHPSNTPKSDSLSHQSPASSPSINPMAHRNQTFGQFNQSKGSSPIPSVIVWLSFVITLAATAFFWLSDYSNVKAISEMENEKNSVVSQLNSESNIKAEEEAINFQNAFLQLSTLVTNRISKADFLTELYTHVVRDVKISTISMSGEGELGVDGATASYRQVADFMLGLKGYKKLTDISLKNVSVSTEEGVPLDQIVTFSISAMVDFGTGAKTEESTADGSAPSPSATGESIPDSTPE